MVGLTTKIINISIDGIPRKDPIIISWIQDYLRRSYRLNDTYLHYTGDITHYYSVVNPPRLLAFCGDKLIADMGMHKFKQFCRNEYKGRIHK